MTEVSNICKECNKSYYVKPSRQKKSNYCSRKCASIGWGKKYKGKNHHMFGKTRPDMVGDKNPMANPKWRKKQKENITKFNQQVLKYLLKGRVVVNKGKTKENYEPLMRMSLKRKQMFKEGTLTHPKGMLGKKHNEKLKVEQSKKSKQNWRKKTFVQAVINGLKPKPNKLEKKIIDLIKKYKLPYKYVGDYKFWIDGKNPDFVSIDNSKKIIELFGDYWHDGIKNDTKQERINHFIKYGFRTLVIWESELKKLTENQIIDKIKNFSERWFYDTKQKNG